MREVGTPFANFEEKCLCSALGKHILGSNGISISFLTFKGLTLL
jgi:hypothetical protein